MGQYNPPFCWRVRKERATLAFWQGYSMKFLASLINGLHNTIGISTPPPDKVAWAAAIWAVSLGFIGLVLFVMLKFIM
jgi:hypothetical protein